MAQDCEPHRDVFAAAEFPGILRAVVAADVAFLLGGGADSWFCLLQYGFGGHEQLSGERIRLEDLYHSGETFFTLGYGDIVPTSAQRERFR